jgi:hypothetical protein
MPPQRRLQSNLVRHFKRIASAGALLLLLTSCGTPTQKYAASKGEGVYFTIPNSWQQISMKELNALEAKSTVTGAAEKLSLVKWQEAYTFDATVPAKSIFNIAATKVPVAFVRVRGLFSDEINAVSYNTLRDIVEPVTEWVNNPTAKTPPYDIIDDYEVVQKGARGVRTIFNFTTNGVSQTIDQTALVSADRQKIYVFVLRCTTVCYNKHIKVISRIADSFTVRGVR